MVTTSVHTEIVIWEVDLKLHDRTINIIAKKIFEI